jgi:hypothetical protein
MQSSERYFLLADLESLWQTFGRLFIKGLFKMVCWQTFSPFGRPCGSTAEGGGKLKLIFWQEAGKRLKKRQNTNILSFSDIFQSCPESMQALTRKFRSELFFY